MFLLRKKYDTRQKIPCVQDSCFLFIEVVSWRLLPNFGHVLPDNWQTSFFSLFIFTIFRKIFGFPKLWFVISEFVSLCVMRIKVRNPTNPITKKCVRRLSLFAGLRVWDLCSRPTFGQDEEFFLHTLSQGLCGCSPAYAVAPAA